MKGVMKSYSSKISDIVFSAREGSRHSRNSLPHGQRRLSGTQIFGEHSCGLSAVQDFFPGATRNSADLNSAHLNSAEPGVHEKFTTGLR